MAVGYLKSTLLSVVWLFQNRLNLSMNRMSIVQLNLESIQSGGNSYNKMKWNEMEWKYLCLFYYSSKRTNLQMIIILN